MKTFRELLDVLDARGELLRVRRPVNSRYELGALLKQAEARERAVVFEAVQGSPWPVAGNVLTSPARFALALDQAEPESFSRDAHAAMIAAAIAEPLPMSLAATAPVQEVVHRGADVDCRQLPVPTFFSGDSGPFITAAVGIARNPDNGVINAGYYRVLVSGPDELVVSVGRGSDLLRFLQADAAAGRITKLALVLGGEPAFQMAAASKTPADRSELDVAGALAGTSLAVVPALCSDLPVPANAEFVLELSIDHQRRVPNTMGEFGDLYGTQEGHVARVEAITHRREPVFHVIRAGAGREHNSIGFIILYGLQQELSQQLRQLQPAVRGVRVHFDPPAMGPTGEVYVQLAADSGVDGLALARQLLGLHCGGYDVARVVRRVILVDEDIDIDEPRTVNWAICNRALSADRYHTLEDLPLPGLPVRLVIDATAPPDQREKLQRLEIPGAAGVRLDDYL